MLRSVTAFWSWPVSAISRSAMTSLVRPSVNTTLSGRALRTSSVFGSQLVFRTKVPPLPEDHLPSSLYGPVEKTAKLDLSPWSWSLRYGSNDRSEANASGKSGHGLLNRYVIVLPSQVTALSKSAL